MACDDHTSSAVLTLANAIAIRQNKLLAASPRARFGAPKDSELVVSQAHAYAFSVRDHASSVNAYHGPMTVEEAYLDRVLYRRSRNKLQGASLGANLKGSVDSGNLVSWKMQVACSTQGADNLARGGIGDVVADL